MHHRLAGEQYLSPSLFLLLPLWEEVDFDWGGGGEDDSPDPEKRSLKLIS